MKRQSKGLENIQRQVHVTHYNALFSRLPCRTEQCRLSAAGEGLVCERQLDAR